MKKELTIEQALAVIKRGETVECQFNKREDEGEIVRTENRLQYLYNLSKSGIQLCKIYSMLNSEEEEKKLPENVIEITFDEAYELVYHEGTVYYMEEGKEEEISTIKKLMELKRMSKVEGRKLLLYWHE